MIFAWRMVRVLGTGPCQAVGGQSAGDPGPSLLLPLATTFHHLPLWAMGAEPGKICRSPHIKFILSWWFLYPRPEPPHAMLPVWAEQCTVGSRPAAVWCKLYLPGLSNIGNPLPGAIWPPAGGEPWGCLPLVLVSPIPNPGGRVRGGDGVLQADISWLDLYTTPTVLPVITLHCSDVAIQWMGW